MKENVSVPGRENQWLEMAMKTARLVPWGWDARNDTFCYPGGVAPDPATDFWPLYPDLRTLKQAVHPEDAARVEEAWTGALSQGTPLEVEFRVRQLGGGYCWVRSQAQIQRDGVGQPQGIAGVSMEITDRRRAEEALKRAHEELEERVRERTAEAETANAALRQKEAQLELALDASNAGTWFWEMEQAASSWDNRYRALYGFTPDEPASFEAWLGRLDPQDRERMAAAIQARLEPGGDDTWNEEFRILHPVKGERWMAGLGRVERDAAGRAVRMAGINLDVTERKQAEQALRESERRQQALLDATSHPMLLMNTAGTILAANAALGYRLGCKSQDLLGKHSYSLLPPDLAARRKAQVEKSIRSGQPMRFEDERAGTVFDNQIHPITNEKGEVVEAAVFSLDITDRKRDEQALRESEAKYRRLHESMTDAFVRVDMTGRVIEFNMAYAQMLGYGAEELRGLTYMDLTPERWHAMEAKIAAEQIIPNGYSGIYQKEYRRKDGTIFPVELRTFLLRDSAGQPAAMWAMVRDITERKRVEKALREQAKIIEDIEDSVVATDLAGVVTFWNTGAERISGYRASEALGQPIAFVYPTDQRHLLEEEIIPTLKEKGACRREVWLACKSGERLCVDLTLSLLRDENGVVYGMIGYSKEVTERRRAEMVQREQLVQIEALYATAPVGLCVLDRDFRYLRVNARLAEMNGVPADQHVGRTVREVVPHLAEATEAMCRQVLTTGQPLLNVEMEGRTAAHPELTRYWVAHWSPLKQADGHVSSVSVVVEEVTARKQAEQARRESERRQQALLNATTHPMMLLDAEGGILAANATLGQRLGQPLETLVGRNVFQMLPPEVATGRQAALKETLRSGKPLRFEDQRAGSVFDNHIYPIADEQGVFNEVAVFSVDITDRKQAEQALREAHDHLEQRVRERTAELEATNRALQESEQKYRALIETTGTGYLILDEHGRVVDANAEYVRLTGQSSLQEILGRSVVEWTAPYDQERNAAEVPKCLQEGLVRNLQMDYVDQQGRITPTEIQATVVRSGSTVQILSLSRDITERRKIEAALRESEERYRSLVNNLNVGVYRNRPGQEGSFIQANPALARMHGYGDVEEFSKIPVADHYQNPADRLHYLAELKRLGSVRNRELRLKRKDGALLIGSVTATAHYGPDGEIEWIDGVLEDITERKHNDQRLAETLDLNRTLISVAPAGIAVYKATGLCILSNEAMARILRAEVNQVLGQDFRRLQSWEEGGLLKLAEQALQSGLLQSGEFQGMTTFGQEVWLDCHLAPFSIGGESHLLLMVNDIMDRKRAENLLLAQRNLGVGLGLANDLEQALNCLLEVAMQTGAFDCGGVYVEDPPAAGFRLQAHRGLSQEYAERVAFYPADSAGAALLGRGQPVRELPEPLKSRLAPLLAREGVQGLFIVPLLHQGRLIGSVNLGSHRYARIPESFCRLAEAIAAQAAGVVVRIRAEEVLRDLPRRILEAAEQERYRVGRDLHDGVNQLLASVKFRLHGLEKRVPARSRLLRTGLHRSHELIGQAIEETRRLAHNLRPPALDDLGLLPACRGLCEDFRARTGVAVGFHAPALAGRLPGTVELHLFRVLQEALTNVEKHARARQVRVSFQRRGSEVELQIKDDGAGFDPQAPRGATAASAGLGLSHLRERAAALGGICDISSRPRKGTVVTIRVPTSTEQTAKPA